jgi:glycosyltransferase involved in cell wall biosynthesis
VTMHIAFVCPGAADLFSPGGAAIGGAERQQGLLGRGLARRGHRVTFVVREAEGLADAEVRLLAVRVRPGGVPGLRKLAHAARLWAGLARVRPDVLVTQGADTLVLDVALFARAARRPFVFLAASDDDFLLRAFHTDARRNLLYRQGLRLADAVVAQTERQRRLARERFRIDAAVVPNPVEIPAESPPPGDEVLWAGTLRSYKRPEVVLALARALPSRRFTVVGGPPPPAAGAAERKAADAFLRAAAGLPNVRCPGPQRPERMDAFFARAAVVVNTSPVEGFPNVLLEGWARGRPAVTAGVDPDGVIARHGLGIAAAGIPSMARALEALLGDPARLRRMGAAGRRYVASRHAVGPVVDRFEALLARLAGRSG